MPPEHRAARAQGRPTRRSRAYLPLLGAAALAVGACAEGGTAEADLDPGAAAVLADRADRVAELLAADDACAADTEVTDLRARTLEQRDQGSVPEEVAGEVLAVLDDLATAIACPADEGDGATDEQDSEPEGDGADADGAQDGGAQDGGGQGDEDGQDSDQGGGGQDGDQGGGGQGGGGQDGERGGGGQGDADQGNPGRGGGQGQGRGRGDDPPGRGSGRG